MKKFLIFLFFSSKAIGEPGPLTQYLINDPATLMDIAMVRSETLTTEFEKRAGLHWTNNGEMVFFGTSVDLYYDPDEDRIYVGINVMSRTPNYTQMEEGCKNVVGQLRIWAGKSLHRLFTHVGYEDPSVGRFWAVQQLGERDMRIGQWEIPNRH